MALKVTLRNNNREEKEDWYNGIYNINGIQILGLLRFSYNILNNHKCPSNSAFLVQTR